MPSICPVCGGDCRPWFARAARHFERCPCCGLIVVPEGLARDAAGVSIYESAESVFLADGNEGYYLDEEVALANARLKRAWLERHLGPGARLLDAGANFGHFLKVAGELYEASGFDISPAAVRWSREHFGVRNEVGSVYDAEPAGRPFDAVTSWDVVEHLSDPLAALARMCDLLRPRGWLFLSTPDAGSLAARLLGRHWYYLDPVQHLSIFSRRNLADALARCGFRLERIGTLGHRYRLGYAFDRLAYLNRGSWLGRVFGLGGRLFGPLRRGSVYLNPGDVLILSARRVERTA